MEIFGTSSEGTNNAPRTVRLFLVDGRARGLTVAEMGNWSGKVLSAPRSGMPQLLRRPECTRTGGYVLMGPDPERPGGAMAYVGEADDVSKRLKRHLATGDNDFFEQAAVVVTSDASLTKAHGRYLEAQLIREAREAGGVRLFNDRYPDFRGLPEADLVDMDIGWLRTVKAATALEMPSPLRRATTALPAPGISTDRQSRRRSVDGTLLSAIAAALAQSKGFRGSRLRLGPR